MTWWKCDVDLVDDPAFTPLSRGERLLYFEGVSWCARQLTDGAIPRSSLRRITDEDDPSAAAEALVEAGFWSATPDGWQIVGYGDEQRTKAQVTKDRVAAVWRAERANLHARGDHRVCATGSRVCPAGAMPWEVWRDLVETCAVAGVTPTQLRALDTDEMREDEVENESKRYGTPHPSASASPAPQGVPFLGDQRPTFTVTMSKPSKGKAAS